MSARPGVQSGLRLACCVPKPALPRGLEIIASCRARRTPTLARIPRTWKLNVAVKEGGKAVAHTRVVMERTTTVKEVLKAVGNAVPMCFSSSPSRTGGLDYQWRNVRRRCVGHGRKSAALRVKCTALRAAVAGREAWLLAVGCWLAAVCV